MNGTRKKEKNITLSEQWVGMIGHRGEGKKQNVKEYDANMQEVTTHE